MQFLLKKSKVQQEFTAFNDSIGRGIDYLFNTQGKEGNYPGSIYYINTGRWCDAPGTVFSTSVITHCLTNIISHLTDKERIEKCRLMIKHSLDFFMQEMYPPGLWRFGIKKDPQWSSLPFDTDDTSCVSFLLKDYHPYIHFGNNKQIILNNRNSDGMFYTWFLPSGSKLINDIDSVINVNACLYLGKCEAAEKVSEKICGLINSGDEEGSFYYYINKFSLYYMTARAYAAGISYFSDCAESIIKNITAENISENFLNEALNLTTLLNFGYKGEDLIKKKMSKIFQAQAGNGSWGKFPFYQGEEYPKPVGIYFGSECLSTALCLEAAAECNGILQDYFTVSRLKNSDTPR